MGIAEVHFENVAVGLNFVADANDFLDCFETFGNTFDHVGCEGAIETVEGLVLLAVGGALETNYAVLDMNLDKGINLLTHLAFGTFDRQNVIIRYRYFHALGQVDGHFTNS